MAKILFLCFRMGFVDPAFLAPHHFAPSPAPSRILEEALPSATRTTEFRREASGLDEDVFKFPNDIASFSHVLLDPDELVSASSNPSKRWGKILRICFSVFKIYWTLQR